MQITLANPRGFCAGVDRAIEIVERTLSLFGTPVYVRHEAVRRKLRVFDAICPLVTKVHMEVGRYQDEGRECILIGHAGHPEVEGTLGQYRSVNGNGAMYLVEVGGGR